MEEKLKLEAMQSEEQFYKALIEKCQAEISALNAQMEHREQVIDQLSAATRRQIDQLKEALRCGNNALTTSSML